MIQQTMRLDSGEKLYIPWTFWSDGNWRKMEPDAKLPLWKPYETRNKAKLMIHEGAKAAEFVDRLINDLEMKEARDAHPWAEELEDYEHWGMIGGALAPGRTDYSELAREAYSEVVYVCDNDFPGQSALQEVSRCYKTAMFGIMFGKDFKEGFDLADDLPEDLFVVSSDGQKRWTGSRLRDMMVPATMATEIVMTEGPNGKPKATTQLTKAFREQWLHSVQPEVYLHRDWPHQMWTQDEFNNYNRPFSHVDNTARLLKTDINAKSAIIKYDPSRKPGVFGSGGEGRFINTYKDPGIEADFKRSRKPWIEFLEQLIPGESDRRELSRWIATLITRPDIRMKYGVLLISEMQGVGKGTLGEKVLAPLVGRTNVSTPSEHDIVEGTFNYWMAHKRLAIVHEIYAGHSSKAYNKLKSLITDSTVLINKKHLASYETDAWLHIFANSNSYRAMRLSDEDRRWLLPRVTEERKPAEYWGEFNRWLKEDFGLEVIKGWAIDFLKKHKPVMPGDVAPWTSLKQEVIEAGDSPGQEKARTLLRRVRSIVRGEADDAKETLAKWEAEGCAKDGKVILLDTQIVRYIQDVVYQGRQVDYLEKPLTIRKLAKGEGFFVGDAKVSTGMNGWGPTAHNGRMISNDEGVAALNPSAIGGKKEVEGVPRLKPLNLDWAREI